MRLLLTPLAGDVAEGPKHKYSYLKRFTDIRKRDANPTGQDVITAVEVEQDDVLYSPTLLYAHPLFGAPL